MAINNKLSSTIAAQNYGTYPFDIRWSLTSNVGSAGSELKKKDVDGTGVFFVSYQNHVIFVGSFNGRNILEQRLIRLLNRLTLRGIHTGFGKCDESKADAVIAALPTTLQPYVSYLKLADLSDKPFKDTGAVVTQADIAFATSQWALHFENADASNILDGFAFSYYQVADEQGAKDLENQMTNDYRFAAMKSAPAVSQVLTTDALDEAVHKAANKINSTSKNAIRCEPTLALNLH